MSRAAFNLTRVLAAGAALAAAGPHAQASITGVTGSTTWLGSPPLGCGVGQLTGPTAKTWNEQQNLSVSLLSADMVNNPGTSGGAVPGTVSGLVSSHFIHWEGTIGSPAVAGSVVFNQPIIGVIFKPANLNATDALLGAIPTTYPTGYPFRGLNAVSSFTIMGNALKYKFLSNSVATELVQLRVITQAPTPGGAAVLGLGGALVGLRRRR